MELDVVIRGGAIVDGTGADAFRADVGISAGRIVEVGRTVSLGRREIDAAGCVVTPGFIDVHTHMDAQLFWDPLGQSSCWHGVTTVLMGNCGFTLAPVRNDQRDLVVRNLERAEDISREAMEAGVPWSWESFPEYLDAVDRQPKALNYACNIGHSALRTWAMGERAFTEHANADDLAQMVAQTEDAVRAGAWGLSTSRATSHETADGRPVASRAAAWSEVVELVHAVGRLGGGPFELAQEPVLFAGSDPADRADFFARLRALARATKVPVTFGLPMLCVDEQVALLDSPEGRDGLLFGQSHCRGINSVMSFRTQMPFDRLDVWKDVRCLSVEKQVAALRDPSTRARLIEAATRGAYPSATGVEAPRPNYATMAVLDAPLPPNPLVADLAAARGISEVELLIQLAIDTNLEQFFVQPFRVNDPADILRLLRHPNTAMTFSDSGAHVTQIMDSSIQTHLLAYWVRQRGEIRLEDAVRMMTAAPASMWGFGERGVVRVGAIADLNVFDPSLVAPLMPTLQHDLPTGAPRLDQRAEGILATIVAGEVVILHGEHTGALPGRLLRRGA